MLRRESVSGLENGYVYVSSEGGAEDGWLEERRLRDDTSSAFKNVKCDFPFRIPFPPFSTL